MSVINSNSAAMITANSLNKNDREMNGIMERLSTGKRINSSADDAAGLAIATKMTAQVRGLDQAGRNANNATSMLQLADGAAEQVSNILQRMREITVQASDGSNSQADIDIINVEFVQAAQEIDRIVDATQFNGKNLLDGTAGGSNSRVSFQIGANDGQILDVDFGDFNLKDGVGAGTVGSLNFGGVSTMKFDITQDIVFTDASNTTTTITAADMAAEGLTQFVAGVPFNGGSGVNNALEVALLANKVFLSEGVDLHMTHHAEVLETYTTEWDDAAVAANSIAGTGPGPKAIAGVDTAGAAITLSAGDLAGVTTAQQLADVVNTKTTLDVSASVEGSFVVLTKKTLGTDLSAGTKVTLGTGSTGVSAGDTVIKGFEEAEISLDSAGFGDYTDWNGLGAANMVNGTQSFTVGANVVGGSSIGSSGGPMGGDLSSFSDATIGMGAGLSATLVSLDLAITGVATQRATFGASMNRLTSVVDNLASASEATSTARGRIEDANYASETTALARSQIISQAGTAMLAQANQKAQSVLSLLQ